MFIRFGDIAIAVDLRIYERDVSLVDLRLLIHERENAPRSRHCHDNIVHLLGKLIDISGKLLGHIEERNKNTYSERHH